MNRNRPLKIRARSVIVTAMRQRGGSGPHHDKRPKLRDRQERRDRRDEQ